MDRLFRSGGLFRSKWDQVHYADGKTYGQVTLENAVGKSHRVHQPGETDRGSFFGLRRRMSSPVDPARRRDQKSSDPPRPALT